MSCGGKDRFNRFTNFARRVPDTEEVKANKESTDSERSQKWLTRNPRS